MTLSNRGQDWNKFSEVMLEHIEGYTVPQYGDSPHDQIGEWSDEVIVMHINRYNNRLKSNARGFKESQRDLLKMAHYCQLLYDKRAQNYKETM